VVACLLIATGVWAKNKRSDYTAVEEPVGVALSNDAWTAIPVVNNRRIAVKLDLPAGETDYVSLLWSPDSSSPSAGTTLGDKYIEANPPWILPINKNVYLYGLASGDGAVTINAQDLLGEY